MVGYEAFQLTYNLLVDFGPNLEPVPGFADTWERAADGKSWTFHIREGMKWSDGTPATAQDACYSWGLALAAIADEANIGAGYLDPGLKDAGVTKVECPDDQTMIAYTEDPPTGSSRPTSRSSPSTSGARTTTRPIGEAKFEAPLVGTGPYTVAEWQTSQFARFVRNPNYWGTQGAADEVVIQFFKSDDTMVQALKAGEIDYARGPNADQLKALQGDPAIKTVAGKRERLDPAGLQHLRHRHRQDDQGRRPVDEGAPGPCLPRRARLRDRQEGARRPRPRRLRRPGHHDHPAGPRRSGTWSRTTPRTFDIELAKQKLDAAGYKLDANGARLDKEGKPISLRLVLPRHGRLLRQGRPVRPGLVRPARDQGDDPASRLRRPSATWCSRRRPRDAEVRVQGRLRHRAVGLVLEPGPERPAPDLPLRRRSARRRTASTATRSTTSSTTRRRPPRRTRSARRSSPRCRTSSTTRRLRHPLLRREPGRLPHRQVRRLAEPAAANGTPFFTYSTLQYTLLTDATAVPSPTAAADGRAGSLGDAGARRPRRSGGGGTGGTGGDSTAPVRRDPRRGPRRGGRRRGGGLPPPAGRPRARRSSRGVDDAMIAPAEGRRAALRHAAGDAPPGPTRCRAGRGPP